jgi:hypothetical protein
VTRKPDRREEHERNRKTIAQGMFWRKDALNINVLPVLCLPLCRDPLRTNFFNNLSVEARRWRARVARCPVARGADFDAGAGRAGSPGCAIELIHLFSL